MLSDLYINYYFDIEDKEWNIAALDVKNVDFRAMPSFDFAPKKFYLQSASADWIF